MSGTSDPFVQTQMDDEEIDRLLDSQGYGIVSLCSGGDPYSVPVSYGYDGEDLYFPFLVTGEDSTKTTYIEDGALARFLVTDVRDLFNWRSVAVTDTVRAIEPETKQWDHFIDVLVEQEWFRPDFEDAAWLESLQGWRLGLSDCQGVERTTVSFE